MYANSFRYLQKQSQMRLISLQEKLNKCLFQEKNINQNGITVKTFY